MNRQERGHVFDDKKFPVVQTMDRRDRHTYVIGKSGSGKTTLLRNLLYQDFESGHGVGVIAPEQEMITEEILPFIPKNRIEDVVYVNPADSEFPVGFNPLELSEGEDIDLKVDETLTVIKSVIGENSGPRMEEILRQTLYALTELPGTTLLDVERLLDRVDDGFRKEVLRAIKDEETKRFFEESYPLMPKDAHLPITTRLGKLLRSRPVRNVLCQKEKNLKFRWCMDTGKIVLFNLSDGVLGTQASQVLGQLVVSKFQLAAMSRADVPPVDRRRFFLYLDEFQTFTGTAGTSYEKILSRARKYRLALILAHQQTGQIPTSLLKEISGNVSTFVSFVVSPDDASKLSKEFIFQVDGKVESMKAGDLLQLKVGQAICKIGQTSFFMLTNLPEEKPDFTVAKEVIKSSRRLYGVPLVETEKEQDQKLEQRIKEIESFTLEDV